MKKKRIITAAVVLGLLVLCLILLMRRGSEANTSQASRGISLALHGLTNIPTKGDVAVFFVTNAGPEHTSFSPDAFEYLKAEVWVTNSLRNKRRDGWLVWQSESTGNPRRGKWVNMRSVSFKSGASGLIAAPMLVTNAPWRLHFHCVERATGSQGIADRASDLFLHTSSVVTNGSARNQMTYSGRQYELISPELSQ